MKLKKVFEEVEKEETTSKGHKYGCVMVNLVLDRLMRVLLIRKLQLNHIR